MSTVNALRSIKNSLIDPYQNLRNWKRGDPCTRNWTGVICHNLTPTDGYLHITEFCQDNGEPVMNRPGMLIMTFDSKYQVLLLDKNLSGTLSPKLGRISYMKILDFMWNNISGTIPKEIGNITSLELLLLSGNQLTGSLPEELGKLSNLNRIQIDENRISGPIPLSFANLSKIRRIDMNNNSLNGPIPPELSGLPILLHLLLDNNNLSGYLPRELSKTQHLLILQLDNNNFNGSTIPSSYGNMTSLLKLNFSNMSNVAYIDLSLNQLDGSIPTCALSQNITVVDLSDNNMNGTIPGSFSELPRLQKLLLLNFTNSRFSDISGSLLTPLMSLSGFAPLLNNNSRLLGNPLCSSVTLAQFCGPNEENLSNSLNTTKFNDCSPQLCQPPNKYATTTLDMPCFCAAPLYIGYRLKSPGFLDFLPYFDAFKEELSFGLGVNIDQLEVDSAIWQKGPRLKMHLKIFPTYINDSLQLVNDSEVLRIRDLFSGWRIKDNHVFGPFEFLNFTLSDAYKDFLPPSSSGLCKGALAGIILGTIAGSVTLSAFVSLIIVRRRIHKHHQHSQKRLFEMARATNNFDSSSLVGEGGYGKVYRGVLRDGKVMETRSWIIL
ncbi:hypothetical protein OROHE_017030 [Orobanche hederae]